MPTKSQTLVTFNRGDHADYSDVREVIGDCAVSLLTEMKSVPNIVNRLGRAGFGTYGGDRLHSDQSVIVWDRELFKPQGFYCVPLLAPDVRDGKRNMAKTLNVVRGVLEGVGHVSLGVAHNIQTVHTPQRKVAALLHNRKIGSYGTRRGFVPLLVGGDFNDEWGVDGRRVKGQGGAGTLRVLSRAGFTCDQAPRSNEGLGAIPTIRNGKRSIDLWALHNPLLAPRRRIEMVSHHTEKTGRSDHLPLYLEIRRIR